MGPDVEKVNAVMIVVGSHLRAEERDRPLAGGLKARIEHWREMHADQMDVPLTPLICTDLWYLNHADLQRRPTICIGGPGVNALQAINANQSEEQASDEQERPPEALEPRVTIMIDPDFTHLRVGIWGTDTELTEKGIQLFEERYLDSYLRACVTQVEPKTD